MQTPHTSARNTKGHYISDQVVAGKKSITKVRVSIENQRLESEVNLSNRDLTTSSKNISTDLQDLQEPPIYKTSAFQERSKGFLDVKTSILERSAMERKEKKELLKLNKVKLAEKFDAVLSIMPRMLNMHDIPLQSLSNAQEQSRISNAINVYASDIQVTANALFKRNGCTDLVREIISYQNLAKMLALRMVCKGFYHLANCFISFNLKAIDLFLGKKSQKIQFIQHNDASIKIIIDSPMNAQCLIKFIGNSDNHHILKNVKAINFGNMDSDTMNRIQQLLNLFVSKNELFPNLTSLSFQNINRPFSLIGLNNLTHLTFKNIYVSFTLSKLPNLVFLSFENIGMSLGGKFKFILSQCPSLGKLSFQNIHVHNVDFMIPEFPKLTYLSFGNLISETGNSVGFDKCCVVIPRMNVLRQLSFQDICVDLEIKTLPSLNFLSFGKVKKSFVFPELPELTTLFFREIGFGVDFTLPEFSNLNMLAFESLSSGSLTFLELPKLTTFVLKHIGPNMLISIHGKFPNLTTFAFDMSFISIMNQYTKATLENLAMIVQDRN